MSRIFIVAKEAHTLGFETGESHTYLVYETDAGERFVTSLTAVTPEFSPPRLVFDVQQINTPYAQAQETSDLNRAERELDFGGRNVDAVWNLINQHALEIRADKPAYTLLTQNSNSFIASLLNVVGVDMAANLPDFNGNHPAPNPQPSDYPGLNNLLDFDYHLVGTPTDDLIRGAGGDDTLSGADGNDTLMGRQGSDALDGGAGLDTASYFGPRAAYAITWNNGPSVLSTFDGFDSLRNIEIIQFADKTEHITDQPLDYIASYTDLIAALGDNAPAGFDHYLGNAYAEGRSVSFDSLEYIASYTDLIMAFHTQVAANPDSEIGASHYIASGHAEQRAPALFDAAQYLANYADLQAAYGNDSEAATLHFITHGYFEERTDHAPA